MIIFKISTQTYILKNNQNLPEHLNMNQWQANIKCFTLMTLRHPM